MVLQLNYSRTGSGVCSSKSVRAEYAEKLVLEELHHLVSDDTFLKKIVDGVNEKRVNSILPLEQEIDQIRKTINTVRGKQEKYFDMLDQGIIDNDMIKGRLEEQNKQIESLMNSESVLKERIKNHSSSPLEYDYVKDKLTLVNQFVGCTDNDQIKTLLHLMIDEIVVRKDSKINQITIVWNDQVQSFIEASSSENGEGALMMGKRVLLIPFVLEIVLYVRF
ncbi:hypothetical protein [Fusibacter sp. JL216-2]|uniref:hypothetical protein n=1 Tax=Fusibacter sp. JL216-2 TaxID=3071453 RepID=UPI003D332F78